MKDSDALKLYLMSLSSLDNPRTEVGAPQPTQEQIVKQQQAQRQQADEIRDAARQRLQFTERAVGQKDQ